jgi:TonB family protein
VKAAAKTTPWLFPEGAIFPVINGELHPLKKHARRLLYRGMIVGMALHLLAFGGWLFARNMKPEPPPAAYEMTIKRVTSAADLGVPPSLTQEVSAADMQVAVATAAAPSIGVPEPVPDFQATTTTLATTDQIAEALAPVDVDQLGSSSDSLVIDESMFANNSSRPDDYQAFDELPVPISTPAPVYPDLARSGDVEGNVKVRACVTKEGKVSDVVVIEGNFLLHDAAIAAVKKWTFKPALQQHKPVQVWVDIPLNFTLD